MDTADENVANPSGILDEPDCCIWWLFRKRWFILIMWQICSLVLCSMNVFNTLLVINNDSTLPFLQLTMSYGLVFLVHIWRFERSKMSWLLYAFTSCLTCCGDVCAIYAYDTTSLASAMLLTTTVVFWVALISVIFLRKKMSVMQVVSVFVGVGGVAILMAADGIEGSSWIGNVLSLASAVCYAISAVLQEKILYSASATVLLCRFSIIVLPISGTLSGAVEWKKIRDYNWELMSYIYLFCYALLLSLYLSLIPFIMQFSSALDMNISLLTANFFSLAVSILAFGQKAEWLYLLGFFCVPVAIALYYIFPYVQNEEQTVAVVDPHLADNSEARVV